MAVPIAAGAAAALAALAAHNRARAAEAERRHPPAGRLVDVAGQKVHVVERGAADAPAVVLVHGNVVTLDDWLVSGVVEALPGRRVVMIDRPGFGYSERPPGRWGVFEQAALLRATCERLAVRRPVVVGQSLGTMVALAWAMDAPATLGGLVVVSGFFYPEVRRDARFVAPAAAPLIGPLLRNTVSPPFARAMMATTLRAMFAPSPVPDRFLREFPLALISRPDQLRAIAEDGSTIAAEAERMTTHPGPVTVPLAVVTGDADRVVDPATQSRRFARELDARLDVLPGVGHMAHHAAPHLVADAAMRMAEAAKG